MAFLSDIFNRAGRVARGQANAGMDVIEDERREVLLVTSLAFGKRTPIAEYRHTSRGGKGVKAFARQRDDIGQVVDQILVAPEDQILMITSGNQVIRLKVGDIRKTGRDAKGVRLQRLGQGDEVIAITNLGKQVVSNPGKTPADQAGGRPTSVVGILRGHEPPLFAGHLFLPFKEKELREAQNHTSRAVSKQSC